MLKQTVTYEGFDGPEAKDFYFNLNKIEAKKFAESKLAEKIQAISTKIEKDEKVDDVEAIAVLEELVLLAYGARQGDTFVKNNEVREEFRGSIPFGELVTDLLTDDTKFAKFFAGIMPADLRGPMLEAMNVAPTEESPLSTLEQAGTVPEPEIPAAIQEPQEDGGTKRMTRKRANELSAEDLQARIVDGWGIVEQL